MKKMMMASLIASLATLVACSSQSVEKPKDKAPEKASEAKPAAQPKVMKLAVVTPKDRSLTKGLDKFAEIVNKESNGSIKAEVYSDGKLGGDRQVFEAMKMGTVEGSTMSSGPIAVDAPRFNALDLPFLFKDEKTAYKVLDGPIGKDLLNDLPKTGVIGLNYWENGFRHLTNSKREVKSVNDIKGLKIRTLENQLHIDMWKQLGAIPSPMAFTELFTALDQKVVDGQENPAGNVTTSKFYEVQKYLTRTGHVYNASVFLISKKFYDTLSDKEKDIVAKAAEEAKNYQRELNQKEDAEAFDLLKQKGMIITDLSPEEKQKFFDTVKPVYEKYSKSLGEDFVNKLIEANK